jgi:hypothetical protein
MSDDIRTNNLSAPGYVWFSCDRYGLPDNTAGKIGYHVTYRPLCGARYKGNELVTERMRADYRTYLARTTQEAERHAANPRTNDQPNPYCEGLSEAEILRRERIFDLINNEGGEGYNPYRDACEPTGN